MSIKFIGVGQLLWEGFQVLHDRFAGNERGRLYHHPAIVNSTRKDNTPLDSDGEPASSKQVDLMRKERTKGKSARN